MLPNVPKRGKNNLKYKKGRKVSIVYELKAIKLDKAIRITQFLSNKYLRKLLL